MNIPSLTIGERLKALRRNRNLTLEEVSKLTDVSKPMLGQIERGQSSPTVNTLWKIATGLKVPLSIFLQEPVAEYSIAEPKTQDMIVESDGAMRAYPLFSFDPMRNFEVFYIEFDSGCNHISAKHNDGVEEYIFVSKGKLDLIINNEIITLEEKQAVKFGANISHSYINPYNELCCVYNTIFYYNI